MDVKVDLNELSNQLGQALKPLADKLGSTATHVFELAVKDVMITGQIERVWCWLIGLAILLCLISIVAGIIHNEDAFFGVGVMGIFFFGLLFSFVFSDCMHNLGNPEYQAVINLLSAVKH